MLPTPAQGWSIKSRYHQYYLVVIGDPGVVGEVACFIMLGTYFSRELTTLSKYSLAVCPDGVMGTRRPGKSLQ